MTTTQHQANWFDLRLITAWVCMCAIIFSAHHQVTEFACCSTIEYECPEHEDGERNLEELVISSSARQRLQSRRHAGQKVSNKYSNRSKQSRDYSPPELLISDHLLTCGQCCAPLMI